MAVKNRKRGKKAKPTVSQRMSLRRVFARAEVIREAWDRQFPSKEPGMSAHARSFVHDLTPSAAT